MLNELKSFIAEYQLAEPNDRLLLAVSGGKDSVIMAHLIHQLNYTFAIAHCNFKLRAEESDGDEKFVEELAYKLNVPFYSQSFDTKTYAIENKLSIQMAARDLRYEWFDNLSKKEGYKKIVTAHHQDDAIETLLIKKSRKSSIGALQGIPVKNANIIRPFLAFSVKQIQNYILENSIEFREDKSNSSAEYQRNNIRKSLQHLSQDKRAKYLDEIERNKNIYSKILKKCERYKTTFCEVKENGILLSFEYLLEQDEKQEILYELLKHYGPFSWRNVFSLLDSEVGRYVANSEFRIVRERQGLFLSKISVNLEEQLLININDTVLTYPISIKLSIHDVKDFKLIKNSRLAALDYSKLHFPLTLRPWQKGDVFIPIGMKGKKKISDFMIDEKFSTYQKENTWVICSLDTIVYIVGHRINDEFKLVPETEKVYLVEPLMNEHGK
ncbi:MAG: tRNA lysidine(34) synthetase TilS [Bacteroidota bacterium]|nr:tRNA lysidine(34) synthetase TilS [Bacteroidota bacterium]